MLEQRGTQAGQPDAGTAWVVDGGAAQELARDIVTNPSLPPAPNSTAMFRYFTGINDPVAPSTELIPPAANTTTCATLNAAARERIARVVVTLTGRATIGRAATSSFEVMNKTLTSDARPERAVRRNPQMLSVGARVAAPARNQRGVALFAAIAGMLLLSTMIAALVVLARNENLIAQLNKDEAQAAYAAEAGANWGRRVMARLDDLPARVFATPRNTMKAALVATYNTPAGGAQFIRDLAIPRGRPHVPASAGPATAWSRSTARSGTFSTASSRS